MKLNKLSVLIMALTMSAISAEYLMKQNTGIKAEDFSLSSNSVSNVILYEFTSHSFTNCGKAGNLGPTLLECRASYSTAWDEDSNNYNMTTQGIQEWTVPETGNYRIEGAGGRGGVQSGASWSHGGKGAYIAGTFELNSGDKVNVVVGHQGLKNSGGSTSNGGGVGGGGSFVWIEGQNQPLIAAGGGGGGALLNTSYVVSLTHGVGGAITVNGAAGNSNISNYGINGGDSDNNSSRGWNYMFSNKNFNGLTHVDYGKTAGFGGGGALESHNTSGGGGYSGGGYSMYGASYAGSGNGDGRNGAGGGGSYNTGTDQTNTADQNDGNGYVIITKL